MTVSSHVHIGGARHLLPLFPSLVIVLSAFLLGVARTRFPRAVGRSLLVLVPFQTLESLQAFPDYTAFFNIPSGGSARGPRYLLDSSIDWGQDLKKLKRYLDSQGTHVTCLAYFGTASPRYYGIQGLGLASSDIARSHPPDCIAAISVNHLYDLFDAPGAMQWLRDKTPTATAGASIYVYDLRTGKGPTLSAKPLPPRQKGAFNVWADPHPVPVCPTLGVGQTHIFWDVARGVGIEVRVGAPDGARLATQLGPGSATTGKWVARGTTFYFQDASPGADTTSPGATLAKLVVETTTGPCD